MKSFVLAIAALGVLSAPAAAQTVACRTEVGRTTCHDVYGNIVTGKNSPLMHAPSSMILNAIKHLAGLPDALYLIPQSIIDSVTYLKKDILKSKMVSLDVDETLIALGISALSNPAAQMALEKLPLLRDCEVYRQIAESQLSEAELAS